MRLPGMLQAVVVCGCLVPWLSAQDAVKVDPQHYSVASENSQVRILKVHYGPHEKSVMHSHPAGVAVFLTDATIRFNYPDGKHEDVRPKRARHNTLPPRATCRKIWATKGWM